MVSGLYLGVMQALDARRRALGWSCAKLDDMAGTQDGYYAKCLHADTPSGRQAGWEMVQLFTDALFPAGTSLMILPARHLDRRQTRAPATPKKAQTRLELGDDVLFAPVQARKPANDPHPQAANGNTQQLALDIASDTTPGRHRAALAEAKRHGPRRIYRRGGGRAA